MSGVCYSEMQFVQGRLQGRYRAKRAVNETVSAPFPAAAAWGPLLLVLAVRRRTVCYCTASRQTGPCYGIYCADARACESIEYY